MNNANVQTSYLFEISLYVKDRNGNPTSIKKTFKTDNAYQLYKFWAKHNVIKKYNKKTKEKLPDAAEAAHILADIHHGLADKLHQSDKE